MLKVYLKFTPQHKLDVLRKKKYDPYNPADYCDELIDMAEIQSEIAKLISSALDDIKNNSTIILSVVKDLLVAQPHLAYKLFSLLNSNKYICQFQEYDDMCFKLAKKLLERGSHVEACRLLLRIPPESLHYQKSQHYLSFAKVKTKTIADKVRKIPNDLSQEEKLEVRLQYYEKAYKKIQELILHEACLTPYSIAKGKMIDDNRARTPASVEKMKKVIQSEYEIKKLIRNIRLELSSLKNPQANQGKNDWHLKESPQLPSALKADIQKEHVLRDHKLERVMSLPDLRLRRLLKFDNKSSDFKCKTPEESPEKYECGKDEDDKSNKPC